jgi:hypothetical protein
MSLRARFRVTYEADFYLWDCQTKEEYIRKVKSDPRLMRASIIEQILSDNYERASVEPDATDVEIKFLHIIDENSKEDYWDLLPPDMADSVYSDMAEQHDGSE